MSTTTRAKVRKVRLSSYDFREFQVGQIVYVAAASNELRSRRVWTEISKTPFCTNMTNAQRIEGWLGTTDGIHRQAIGIGIVSSISASDSHGDRWITIQMETI